MRYPSFFPPFSLVIGLVITVLWIPDPANAVPAFARQKAKPCTSCHFQHFPALNKFGREFRAEGYVMLDEDEQGVIREDGLSLPMTLNTAVIAKLRYQKTNGNSKEGSDYGAIEWPDEAALMVGGRLAENAGFLMELGLVDANSFLSTKIHFNVAKVNDTRLSIIPFSTDGLGVAYGFELLNTGAQRSQRPIEARSSYSAAQALGLGSGEATGIALVASNDQFFLNYTPWVPGWGESNTTVKPSGLSHYLRAAYTPAIGTVEAGFGVQYWYGEATTALNDESGDTLDIETSGWVIDAQAQSDLYSMPLGVYASYGSCQGSATHFADNCQNNDDATAFGLLAQLGFVPNVAAVYAAFRSMDIGTGEDADFDVWVLGLNYMYTPNVRFELFYERESGSGVDARPSEQDDRLLFQLFAGF